MPPTPTNQPQPLPVPSLGQLTSYEWDQLCRYEQKQGQEDAEKAAEKAKRITDHFAYEEEKRQAALDEIQRQAHRAARKIAIRQGAAAIDRLQEPTKGFLNGVGIMLFDDDVDTRTDAKKAADDIKLAQYRLLEDVIYPQVCAIKASDRALRQYANSNYETSDTEDAETAEAENEAFLEALLDEEEALEVMRHDPSIGFFDWEWICDQWEANGRPDPESERPDEPYLNDELPEPLTYDPDDDIDNQIAQGYEPWNDPNLPDDSEPPEYLSDTAVAVFPLRGRCSAAQTAYLAAIRETDWTLPLATHKVPNF